MNPKDKSIIEVIDKILKKFESHNIKVTDYWDADLCAVGFTGDKDGYLVYVSTYGKNEDEYYVSLEDPSLDEDVPYETKADHENVSYSELENLISEHLIGR